MMMTTTILMILMIAMMMMTIMVMILTTVMMMMTIMVVILTTVMMGTNKERRVPTPPSSVPCVYNATALHIAYIAYTYYI